MSIWERTRSALAGLSVPVAAGVFVSPSGGEIPDLYLVYSLVSSPTEQYADDQEVLRSYRMQVSIYSRNGLENLPNVAGVMTAAGFSTGPIRELPYNPQTRHYGLACEYVFTEGA